MPSTRNIVSAGGEPWDPTPSEVLVAVKSLCTDQMKPFGRLVLKRLRERAAESRGCGLDGVPLIDPKQLRKTCERCRELNVVPDEGKEYAALLVGRNLLFIDPTGAIDTYPPQMWVDLERYVLGDACGPLPASRYDAATVLQSRQLSFLQGYSLGKVCHIVQLAVSHRNLLGHRGGKLVPYHASLQHEKEICAMKQDVYSNNDSTTHSTLRVVSSWDEVAVHTHQLLLENEGRIMLSAMKRLFKSRFNLDLCETVLGHRRLFELLKDPRLHGVCALVPHFDGQLAVCHPVPFCAPLPHMCAFPAMPGQTVSMGCASVPQASVLCLSTSPVARNSLTINIELPACEDEANIGLEDCVSPGTTPRRSHFSWNLDQAEEATIEPILGLKAGETKSDTASTIAESHCSADFDELSSVGTFIKNTFLELAEEGENDLVRKTMRRAHSVPRCMRA